MQATFPSTAPLIKTPALSPAVKRHLPFTFLLIFCGLLFFWGLGDRDLLSSHEARAAQNGQMIVSDGYWGLPRLFDRHLEMQKPPLYYWLVALLGHLLGGQVDAWAVRLPAALSALGCVLFVYYLGRKCGRARAGFLAALVLASCLHFTWLARVGRIDMPLTLTVTMAGGGFYLGMRAKNLGHDRAWPWFFLAYVSVALGILLKGPIALLLTGVIVGTFAFSLRRSPGNKDGRPTATGLGASLWWGMPLVLLIAAPWFVWANYETNNQIWEVFFYYHNIERGLGASDTLASHPFWFYAPRVLIDLFPWSVALPATIWWLIKRKHRSHGLEIHDQADQAGTSIP
ncbi:MAG TPA: glycosyltransferase family 39 protein, partial [Gemmataceae bacterium]|nr:glycosyltransferase family 39 protein [Gemmataceae bacterium]